MILDRMRNIHSYSLLLLYDSHNCYNVFIASVTICYLSCFMGVKCRSLRPLGSRLGKWGFPFERWSICLMLNCSLMNTPDWILGDLMTPSSCTACSCMLLGRVGKRQRGSSVEANGKPYPDQIPRQPYLPYNMWTIEPLGKKSRTCLMRYTH